MKDEAEQANDMFVSLDLLLVGLTQLKARHFVEIPVSKFDVFKQSQQEVRPVDDLLLKLRNLF